MLEETECPASKRELAPLRRKVSLRHTAIVRCFAIFSKSYRGDARPSRSPVTQPRGCGRRYTRSVGTVDREAHRDEYVLETERGGDCQRGSREVRGLRVRISREGRKASSGHETPKKNRCSVDVPFPAAAAGRVSAIDETDGAPFARYTKFSLDLDGRCAYRWRPFDAKRYSPHG